MGTQLRAGDLVVLQQRWNVSANLLGIALGNDGEEWLILWATGDKQTQLRWHLASALLRVDDHSSAEVRQRCHLAG